MEEEERNAIVGRELWVKENLEKYQTEKAEEERESRVNSTRYRQWKRWRKKNG